MATDPRKKLVFIRGDYLDEMTAEARRRQWSVSRVAQLAVRIAISKLRELPDGDAERERPDMRTKAKA